MKRSLYFCAIGALAIAGSGCAYQGASYGTHAPASYPTPYYGGCGSSYTPQGCATNAGGTRFDLEVGAEQFVSGDIIGAGNALGGGDTTLDVGYKDAFKTGYRVAAGLAKDINPSTTLSAKGFYNQAEGEDNVVFGSGGQTASFSDYKSYGAELGLRKYVGYGGSQLRPYLGGTVGAAYVDDINATSGGGTIVLNDATWVPTASGTAGFEMPFSHSGALALETGLRWTGKQDRSAALGLGKDSSRLSVPVTLRGTFRF